MLSICWYVTVDVDDAVGLTFTLIVDVSINELSNINFWSSELSNLNCLVKYVPWLIVRLSKFTTKSFPSFTTCLEIFSDIEKI